MDITQERQIGEINPLLVKLMEKLQLTPDSKIELKGSYNLLSRKYFGDYDFLSVVKNLNPEEVMTRIKHFLQLFKESKDIYFIELKFQSKDGKKIRFKHDDNFDLDNVLEIWDQLAFIKLDLIIFNDNIFTEASILYQIGEMSETDIVKSLKDEITISKSEKEYYKVLKRSFSLLNITNPNDARIGTLLKFFNSGYGALYKMMSNLQTIKILLEHYSNVDVKKKVEVNLKDIKLNKFIKNNNDLDNLIKKYQNTLNLASEKLIKKLDL